MSDAEKTLREWIYACRGQHSDLEAAQAMLTAALSRTRAEAAEVAWRAVSGTRMGDATASETRSMDVAAIRALIATPAPASIPVETVRGVLSKALSLDDDGRPDFDEGWACAVMHVASKLDALGMPGGAAIAPSKDAIPVERVREMFREALEYSWLRPAQATALARILGVDLDAKGGWTHEHERDGGPATHPDAKGDTTCRECGHPPHPARCVRAVSPQHSRGGAVAARACGCEARP